MTEVDVMNDLLFCERKDCESCSRGPNHPTCIEALMRDARSIIKMQSGALSCAENTANSYREEITNLRLNVKHNFEKKQLVQQVNRVIEAFGEDEYWDEDVRYGTIDVQVDALRGLLNLIGWENCKIVIERLGKYPQILYTE
jgi:hypothetical protein